MKKKIYLEEEWRDIKGYEGLYQVSNCGRIKSLSRLIYNVGHGYTKRSSERIKKLGTHTKGYLQVQLCKNGANKTIKVHRLVAQAFIPNPNNFLQVDHIDGDKTNNHVTNLEWVTNTENHKRKMCMGLNVNLSGEKHGRNKYSEEVVKKLYIEYLNGIPQNKLALKYNVNKTTVNAICNKRIWLKTTNKIDKEIERNE